MFGIILSIIAVFSLFILLNLVQTGSGFKFRLRFRSILSLFGLIFILLSMINTVEGNAQGIVYNPLSGGIQEESIGEGLHFLNPLAEVYSVSTKLREETFEVTAQTGKIEKLNDEGVLEETGGGQYATYEVTVQFRVERSDAVKFYRNFNGTTVEKSTIEARIREALQSTSVDYDIFSILKGSLNDVRAEAEIELKASLEELGISLEAFIILDVDAGADIEQVVADEAIAAKQKEIAIKEQEAALIRKETEKFEAEINAETVVIAATANAEAEQILKSVTANAIYTMYEGQFLDSDGNIDTVAKENFELNGVGEYLTITAISDIIIKQLYYDTWDGVLPEVLTSGETSILVTP